MIPSHLIEKTRNRILAKVEPEPYSGCWIWAGSYTGGNRTVQQRPAMSVNSKTDFVSRYSIKAFRGIIADKVFVLHKCDTPACVNPAHLFIGTAQTNMEDMSRKFRGRPHGIPQKTSNFI